MKELERELRGLRQEQINLRVDALMGREAKEVNGTTCLVARLDAAMYPKKSLQILLESVAGKLDQGLAVFTHVEEGTLSILAAVGRSAQKTIKAGDLVKELSQHADGRGGGRPDWAQAGSRHPEKEGLVLDEARKKVSALFG